MPPPVAKLLRAVLPADRAALLAGFALLFGGYLFAFATTLDQPLLRSVSFAAINTAGACVASLLFHPLIARFVVGRRPPWPALLHPLLAAGFAVAWYFCTLAGFAITPNWMNDGLRVASFGSVALSWQIFQGVTVYAALALFIHWRRALSDLEQRRQAPPEPAARTPAAARPESLLIRCDKEVVPVAASDLIRIAGADGYSEVITRTRRILSVTSLARFEEILPADQFVRAHRSHIVRLASVELAEPAGNARLLLHLEDGARIMTSRAGAKRLRDLTV
ncbi:MAG: hypothetical protein K0R83_2143 [Caulobacter sp.]|nr:hypothetical protein [Caulobacter sp.]